MSKPKAVLDILQALSGEKIVCAYSFRHRLLGFHGVSREITAIHIAPCKMIHTLAMKQPISLIWLGREMEVLRVDSDVPGNTVRICKTATSVIELRQGIESGAQVS